MEAKQRYSPEEKLRIVRDLLEHQVPISELADRYKVSPGIIYTWRKQFFEGGSVVFEKRNTEARRKKELEQRIAELGATLSIRENVISELASEVIELKKKTHGATSRKSGLSKTFVMKS